MKYLIIDHCRQNRKEKIYWKPNRRGYTNNIDEAGRYTIQECKFICSQYQVRDYWIDDPDDSGNPIDEFFFDI